MTFPHTFGCFRIQTNTHTGLGLFLALHATWVLCVLFMGNARAQERHTIQGSDFEVEVNSLGNITGKGLYLLPDSISVLRFTGLWISAKRQDSSVIGGVSLSELKHNYSPGPYHILPQNAREWDRVYPADAQQISRHIRDYNEPGYILPQGIENWPATRPNNRPFPIAPFVDWNQNGIYEPHLGEYPYIEGHNTVLSVYSNSLTHQSSGLGAPSGLECKDFTYLYWEPESRSQLLLKRVIISHFGSQPLYEFRAGVFAHIELQQHPMQYIRSFPAWQAMSVYNLGRPQNGPHEHGFAITIQFLNKRLNRSMYIELDSNSVTGMPGSVEEVNHYLNGRWRNGRNLFYGNNGVDGNDPAHYVFPANQDTTNPVFSWTEENSGMEPQPKAILLSPPPEVLMPGQSYELRYVIALSKNLSDSLNELSNQIQSVQQLYKKGELSTVHPPPKTETVQTQLYPNPAIRGSEVKLKIISGTPTRVEIIDSQGKSIGTSLTPLHNYYQMVAPHTPGIYTVKIQSNIGVSNVRLVVL